MKRLFVVVLAVIIVCGVAQLTFAGRTSETPAGTILDPYVDKSAAGTKVFGPMTAHYEILAEPGESIECPDDYEVSMVVSLRLTKGSSVYKFSSGESAPVCYLDPSEQSAFVYNWLNNTVIPGVFSSYQSWAVKGYSTIADCGFGIDGNNEPGCDTLFTTVDIILAIVE